MRARPNETILSAIDQYRLCFISVRSAGGKRLMVVSMKTIILNFYKMPFDNLIYNSE